MTDDIMSDCVEGDYVIEKMPKNDEICVANTIKGMVPGFFSCQFLILFESCFFLVK